MKRGLDAVIAVGVRPCSGAILVLVFALSQGIFGVGVMATFAMAVGTAITVAAIALFGLGEGNCCSPCEGANRSGATIAILGIEFAAALLIVAFGALLFTGFMASE